MIRLLAPNDIIMDWNRNSRTLTIGKLILNLEESKLMFSASFDRSKHVYINDAFSELVKDAVRFFNGTPVHMLPPPEAFVGTGVYAMYYTGRSKIYAAYGELNRLSYSYPIYVGKAVPSGWRQARVSDDNAKQEPKLFHRLRQHSRSIDIGGGLQLKDFACRFVILEKTSSDMIGTIEAALIKLNSPLWNTVVDGFGNHDPGKGRYEQAKSDWDVIHPGRKWAVKCKGKHASKVTIGLNIKNYLEKLNR